MWDKFIKYWKKKRPCVKSLRKELGACVNIDDTKALKKKINDYCIARKL